MRRETISNVKVAVGGICQEVCQRKKKEKGKLPMMSAKVRTFVLIFALLTTILILKYISKLFLCNEPAYNLVG